MERKASVFAEKASKTYVSRAGVVKAVDEASMSANRGEVTTILGPSGAGKTTLLYLLGSLEKADVGRITVAGRDLTDPMTDLIEFRRRCVGFVFQFFNLIPSLTALENVTLPMDLAGVPCDERSERGVALLERVGISGRLISWRPSRMSGGRTREWR